MAGFLYFVPDVPAVPASMLAALGLDRVMDGVRQGPIDSGPGGRGGVLLADGASDSPSLAYLPTIQRWIPVQREGASYWIGFVTDAPPAAGDLSRERQIAGVDVVLCDGSAWLVPVARLLAGGSGLPRRYGFDDAGNMALTVEGRYRRLWDLALAFFERYVIERISVTHAELLTLASEALGVNYRVGMSELVALGLLDETNVLDVCMATCDWAAIEELTNEKKKHPAG